MSLRRRDWLKLLPALAGWLAAETDLGAQPGAPTGAGRVTAEMLAAALETIGLDFTPAERQMMLPNLNRSLANYGTLRAFAVPLDTEPAIRFNPALPGFTLPERKTKFAPRKAPKARRDWASPDELAFRSVTELAPLVRKRLVTSSELTRMYLARLRKHAPTLNCVISFTEELAIQQAAEADREIRRGHYRGPLHGIPYGAKDLFATRGIPTTWGAEPFQNQVFDYDATAVERLAQAGAVLLAKLSMGALAQGGLWFGGLTRNPWNTDESSSGSSAGSAAATSAGLVGFSIGTETLGSIISPSTRCGVTGLRPTYGRVSRFGAMGLSWTMDKVGPICRSTEDCALVLRALYGPDGKDLSVVEAPLDWQPGAPLSRLRAGYLQEEFDRLQGDQRGIYDDALQALRQAGVRLEPVALPKFPTGSLLIILAAEAATAFDDITRGRQVDQLKGQQPGDWPNQFRSSRLIPAVEYLRAQRARTLLMRQMNELMSKWDALVSPSSSATLAITNLTGHPQVVVPCGFPGQEPGKKEPLGLLFTGRLYQEGPLLRVALAFEAATEWHKQHPAAFL